jgi:hypothetical protein
MSQISHTIKLLAELHGGHKIGSVLITKKLLIKVEKFVTGSPNSKIGQKKH